MRTMSVGSLIDADEFIKKMLKVFTEDGRNYEI
jgi:hypothetical protein